MGGNAIPRESEGLPLFVSSNDGPSELECWRWWRTVSPQVSLTHSPISEVPVIFRVRLEDDGEASSLAGLNRESHRPSTVLLYMHC
jgi:hypothetical protein